MYIQSGSVCQFFRRDQTEPQYICICMVYVCMYGICLCVGVCKQIFYFFLLFRFVGHEPMFIPLSTYSHKQLKKGTCEKLMYTDLK